MSSKVHIDSAGSQDEAVYRNKFSLTGRVAVVTGGGRNVGLAIAHALAEAGARVIITGRPASETSERGRKELARRGFEVDVSQFDITDPDEVRQARDDISERFGEVDILVCNSGRGKQSISAENVDDETWREMIDVNLTGVFWCCREFGRQMLEEGHGSIVIIGSISGTIVNRPQPQSYYNVAKAGVHHLTRCLAAEWAGRGVRVNCVAPTYIDNGPNRYGRNDPNLFPKWMDMTPMHRQGTWEEVASATMFLASDAASLITGQIVHTDGGYTLW